MVVVGRRSDSNLDAQRQTHLQRLGLCSTEQRPVGELHFAVPVIRSHASRTSTNLTVNAYLAFFLSKNLELYEAVRRPAEHTVKETKQTKKRTAIHGGPAKLANQAVCALLVDELFDCALFIRVELNTDCATHINKHKMET